METRRTSIEIFGDMMKLKLIIPRETNLNVGNIQDLQELMDINNIERLGNKYIISAVTKDTNDLVAKIEKILEDTKFRIEIGS